MYTFIQQASALKAFVLAALFVAFGMAAFFALEPQVGRTQVNEVFTVTQEITDEISFVVAPADVSMVGSIAGLTGGYATGTTQAVIRSNDAQGYTMTLAFSNNPAMNRPGSGSINNYTPAVPGVPDFGWVENGTGQAAEFGYTVTASTSGQVDLAFRNNGSACNVGSNETAHTCWLNPSTTPKTIMSTTAPTDSSTSTITFRVAVPNSPSPALPSGFYIATGTLTATNNP